MIRETGRKGTNYLAHRIGWLAAIGGLLFLALLIFCGKFIVLEAGSMWPFLAAAAAFAGVAAAFFLLVLKPYLRFEKTMKLFADGYTTTDIADLYEVAPTPAAFLLFERMSDMMDSSELLKLNKRQAQYLALQNQINPHFLYNTLESIRSEALTAGLVNVAEMTEALATFFRYTISKVENLVSVEEELQNCETYFRIQQYRFGTRLSLSIECDPEERDEIYCCRLPKLTMQPILENSIIHGTECKLGSGHLCIHLERSAKRLLIRISDDGIGMDETALAKMNERLEKSGRAFDTQDSETKGGIALVNVNNRIHLLFGEEYGLRVFSMPGVGTDVEIALPAITSDREIPNKEALA